MTRFPRMAVTLLVCGALPAVVLAQDAKPVSTIPAQLKWESNPGAPEVKTATVWGDMNAGPHGAFHKFPAGFVAPLHTHSANMRAVVVTGIMSLTDNSGNKVMLPTGSYFFQPSSWQHVTKCEPGMDCMIYVTADGKFDMKPVEAKK